MQAGRNIKFGRGVVSKTTYVAAIVAGAWAVAVFRMGENIMANAAMLIACSVVTAFSVWYIRSSQTFAKENPSLALLDGAELIEWQKLEMAAKGGILQSPDDTKMLEIKPALDSKSG